MSKSVKSIRDSMKLGGGQALVTCFSVIYFIIVTQRFSKLELSSIAILSTISGLSNMASALGLTNTLFQRVPNLLKTKDVSKVSGLLHLLLWIPLMASILIGLILAYFAVPVSQVFFKTPSYGSVVMVIACGVVASRLYESCYFSLQVLDQFGRLSIFRTVNDILTRIFALIAYFYYGIIGFLITLILGQLIISVVAILWMYSILRVKPIVENWKELFSYSMPFYGYGFLNFATTQGDQFLIGVFLTPELLATYYIARRFFDYLYILIDTILRPVIPKFAEIHSGSMEILQNAFYRTSRYLSMTIIPVSIFIAAYSYPLFEIYGKGKYVDGIPALIFLCFAAIVRSLYYLFSLIVWVGTKPINTLVLESVGGLSSLALYGIFLLFSSNITGFAVIRVIAIIIATVFARSLMKRRRGFLPVDWNAWIRIFLISMLSAIPSIALQIVFYRLWIIPFYVLINLLVYLFLFARYLSAEDIQLFSNALPASLSQKMMRLVYFIRREQFPNTIN